MENRALMRKQLDRQLEDWQKLKPRNQPPQGWVRTIRKALGMTTQQLATRVGVHRMRIVQLEHAELKDAVTLRSLRTIAKKLNCELIYALVPQTSLQTALEKQAMKIAKHQVQQVAHSMLLEDQAVSDLQNKEQVEELAKKLLGGSPKHLWNAE